MGQRSSEVQNRPVDFNVTQRVHWYAFSCHGANNIKKKFYLSSLGTVSMI